MIVRHHQRGRTTNKYGLGQGGLRIWNPLEIAEARHRLQVPLLEPWSGHRSVYLDEGVRVGSGAPPATLIGMIVRGPPG